MHEPSQPDTASSHAEDAGPSRAVAPDPPARVLPAGSFGALLDALRSRGYEVIGPTVRDGAIVLGPIESVADLPVDRTDRQGPGRYRLEERTDGAFFGFSVGPQSWKNYLAPSRERLWSAHRTGERFTVRPAAEEAVPRRAFLGARACDVRAIAILDEVHARAGDSTYAARRDRTLRIAVECTQAGATCFCVSMGTGPGVRESFDIALSEIVAPGPHRFLVRIGTPAGAEVVRELPMRPADPEDLALAAGQVERVAGSMGRTLDATTVRDLVRSNPEHPEWDRVAQRCLACANCTFACPTCFCHTTEEVPDITGDHVERWRRWDSCFTAAFTELHGTPVRASPKARYRQWLTHKLSTWYDQFGSSGCVGCGRCITWCPVGIDLTEEVAALRRPAAREEP